MEGQVSNDEAYCSILKTVYLFLENNNLRETSESFLREITQNANCGVNFNDINPRTLILRPCDLNSPAAVAISNDRQVIICITETQDETDVSLQPDENTTSNYDTQTEKEPKAVCGCPKDVKCTKYDDAMDQTNDKACPKKFKTILPLQECTCPNTPQMKVLECNSASCSNNKNITTPANIEEDQTQKSVHVSQASTKKDATSISSATAESAPLSKSTSEKKEDEESKSGNSSIASSTPDSGSDSDDKTKNDSFTNATSQTTQQQSSSHYTCNAQDAFIPLEKKSVLENIPDEPQPIKDGIFEPVVSADVSRVLDEMTKENLGRIQQFASKQTSEKRITPQSSAFISEGIPEFESVKCTGMDTPNTAEVSRILHEMTMENGVCIDTFVEDAQAQQHAANEVTSVKTASNYSGKSATFKRSNEKSYQEQMASESYTTKENVSVKEIADAATDSPKTIKTQDESDKEQLNFNLIKKNLLDGNESTKLRLLQALRWRLTKTNNNIRDHNLVNFIRNDILYLNSPWARSNGQTFFETYFYPLNKTTPHALQETMSRFINTIASLQMGRDYLGKNTDIIELIILRVLMGKTDIDVNISKKTREFLIATIQKLSLNSDLRSLMIRAGIVEWLINVLLKTHLTMSNYEAEYAVALLTNLCINAEITLRCEYLTKTIGPLLVVLLNTPHKCCLPYLIGIFYTFLKNEKISKDLTDMGVIATLKDSLKQIQDEQIYKQLDYILNMEPCYDSCLCDYCVTEDTHSFPDYIEDELDEDDDRHVEPNGETLLDEYKRPYRSQENHIHILRNQCYSILKNKALLNSEYSPNNLNTVLEENPEDASKDNTSSKFQISTTTSGKERSAVPVKDRRSADKSRRDSSSNSMSDSKQSNSKSPNRDKSLNKSKEKRSSERDRFFVSDSEKAFIVQNEKKALLAEKKMENEKKMLEQYLGIGGKYQYLSERDKDCKCSCNEMPEVEPQFHPSGSSCFPHPIPCQLSYYYCNQQTVPDPSLVENKGSKYSCPCYDSILAFLKDEAAKQKVPRNWGRKSSNVVYGPFKNQVTCTCPSTTHSNVQSNIFDSYPKVQRTP